MELKRFQLAVLLRAAKLLEQEAREYVEYGIDDSEADRTLCGKRAAVMLGTAQGLRNIVNLRKAEIKQFFDAHPEATRPSTRNTRRKRKKRAQAQAESRG